MANSAKQRRRLWEAYAFPGFRPQSTVRGVFGDPKARVIVVVRRSKKRSAVAVVERTGAGTTDARDRSRSAVWRRAHLPGDRGASGAVQGLPAREERATGLPRGQPLLYQALCLLRRAALSSGHHQRRCRGIPASLGDDQDSGDAVHAGAAGQGRHARSQGNRHRRDLDSQGTHLPHCGERPDSRAPDLVRRRGSLREEHGDVLRRAGREEDQGHSPGGDGHVEAVSQRDQRTRPAGGDSLRQVPHHASSGQSARRGAQERVPADSAAGTAATSRARSTRCSRAGRT